MLDLRRTLEGKGVFLYYLHSAPPSRAAVSGKAVAKRCVAAGVEWVCPLLLWQELPGRKAKTRAPVSTIAPGVEVLADAGIRSVPWVYAVPGQVDGVRRAAERGWQECGTRALILDVEAEWYGRDDDEAAELVQALAADGTEVIACSFGAPWFHRSFPWRGFLASAHWGAPQVYDGGPTSLGPDYPARGVEAYAEFLGDRVTPLARGYTASSGARYRKKEMLAQLERTPVPSGGLGVWDFSGLCEVPARWEALAAFEIPGRS